MRDRSMIIANQGYLGMMYLSHVTLDRKPILGGLGKISLTGEFSPPNLIEVCERLMREGAIMEHLAQASLELALGL